MGQTGRGGAMTKRDLGLGYLRAFLVVQVVAFHSVLAYVDLGPVARAIAPIGDTRQWPGFLIFSWSSDVFFMSLMFFISGLFVWPNLKRKGAWGFARTRALRLGLPFVLGVVLLMPPTYYPVFRAAGMKLDFFAYWGELISHQIWMAGPLWFLWLLLVFDLLAVGLYRAAPIAGATLGRWTAAAARHPLRFILAFLACAAIAYTPLDELFGRRWVSFGPFALAPNRSLHYALYFSVGVGVGAGGLDRGLLGCDSLLVRRWPRWALTAVILQGLYSVLPYPLTGASTALPPFLAAIISGLVFVSTCAATGFALLAVFRRFVTRPVAALDSLAANSYGIYVVHYFFVVWAQYLLLDWALPAVLKASLVFSSALASSWLCAVLFRRVPLLYERRLQPARGVPDP
jgi:peptidoglycan/LPS O-acetylase OafA/YrhL